MLQKDSKKRPLEEEDTSMLKKRVMNEASNSPVVNDIAQDEVNAYANLELFRKEALYRQMKYYSRENERSQSRIAELERRKSTCEAGLAALSACWSQLVEAIKVLVNPDDLSAITIDAKEIFNLSSQLQGETTPELMAALNYTSDATQALVAKVVSIESCSRTQDISFAEYQRIQTECSALRSQLAMMGSQLEDCQHQRDKYHKALALAENRLERSRSATVQAMHAPAKSRIAEEGGSEEKEEKPSSPSPPPSLPSAEFRDPSIDIAALTDCVRLREETIVALERELSTLRGEKYVLETELQSASAEYVTESPHYKVVVHHASTLEADVKELRQRNGKLSEEIDQLQEFRRIWENDVKTSAQQPIEELKAMLVKRDQDISRIREQRDQLEMDHMEFKRRENLKLASTKEIKALAEQRSERILALESENRRYKAHFAAKSNDKEAMLFYLDGNLESSVFVEKLKEKLSKAENTLAAVAQTISVSQPEQAGIVQHVRTGADVLQKLSETLAQLEQYQRVYGDISSYPPDVAALTDRLRMMETENERLRLLEKQYSESETLLYLELDKLSGSWEAMEKQLTSKVFDLSSREELIQKFENNRNKLENKYYALVRAKEAIESERKAQGPSIEKQGKMIELLVQEGNSLKEKLSTMESEVSNSRKVIEVVKGKLDETAREAAEWKSKLLAEKERWSRSTSGFTQHQMMLNHKAKVLRAMEDDFIQKQGKLEAQSARLKEYMDHAARYRKDGVFDKGDLDIDNLKEMIKCSICKDNYRQVALTRCLHTFCKPCVEARITTRQRKCPSCNLPFKESEVLTLFFQ